MRRPSSILSDRAGAAAAEMALIAPLMLTILFGSLELGNYFMNEHTLAKAVRNGARFAARQSYTNYTACSGSPGGTVVADTRDIVMYGLMPSGPIIIPGPITPNINPSDITVTTSCATTAGGQTMSGIYQDRPTGAQIVKVSATVNYRPVLVAFGFSGVGLRLNAASEAAVTGL